MDLLEIHNRLDFFINQAQGEYFPPPVLDENLDLGQMAYFNDLYIKFAESQRIDDALSPFKRKFNFSIATSPGGIINTPDDYFDQISIRTIAQNAKGITKQRPCPRLNEDEIAGRLNSQVYPPTLWDPFSETLENWDIQLYPQQGQAGILSYLSRPPIPNLVYTTPGGVFTYNQLASTQMIWADKDIMSVIIKTLTYIGISVREQDLIQWSMQMDQANIATLDKA